MQGPSGRGRPARGRRRRAHHPHAQRAADPGREKDGASDIHIEPRERSSRCASRRRHAARGGAAQPALHAALISRLKIMAELDIAEKRLPQDGRIRCASAAAPSTCACRRCPRHTASARCCACWTRPNRSSPRGLGMSGDVLAAFDRLVHQPHGIVLVTGPTGSGKTTTLYASLGRWTPPARQHPHGGRSGRVRTARASGRPRSTPRSSSPSPRHCAPSCARIRT